MAKIFLLDDNSFFRIFFNRLILKKPPSSLCKIFKSSLKTVFSQARTMTLFPNWCLRILKREHKFKFVENMGRVFLNSYRLSSGGERQELKCRGSPKFQRWWRPPGNTIKPPVMPFRTAAKISDNKYFFVSHKLKSLKCKTRPKLMQRRLAY